MHIEFTNDTIFSFPGPNLCFLGTPEDFQNLALAILELTSPNSSVIVRVSELSFVKFEGQEKDIVFAAENSTKSLARLDGDKIVFELDSRYWERLFKFFALMSWNKRTYYLNVDEDCLIDLELDQECNFICSSEFSV